MVLNVNFWMTCFSMAAVIIMVSFFLTVPQRWTLREENPPVTMEKQQIPKEDYAYLLKEHKGKLAVFFPGEKQPREIFEVYISTLPEYDQQQLGEGLPVKDYEELLRRLEDYSS